MWSNLAAALIYLIAAGTPTPRDAELALTGLSLALVQSLDVDWTNSRSGNSGSAHVRGTSKNAHGDTCKTVESTFNDQTQDFYACLINDKTWLVNEKWILYVMVAKLDKCRAMTVDARLDTGYHRVEAIFCINGNRWKN